MLPDVFLSLTLLNGLDGPVFGKWADKIVTEFTSLKSNNGTESLYFKLMAEGVIREMKFPSADEIVKRMREFQAGLDCKDVKTEG